MHDSTVDRTTNGHGPVNSFSLTHLQELSAGAHHRNAAFFQNERVPTLEQAVLGAQALNLGVFLDIKSCPRVCLFPLHMSFLVAI
jgi:glycerophosphoryl diester phosphodiesterase